MSSLISTCNLFETIPFLSEKELLDLVVIGAQENPLVHQIVLVKCSFLKSKKTVKEFKEIINEALSYERPYADANWGSYDNYLHEIKKSILNIKNDFSVPQVIELLEYLAGKANDDHVVGEFGEDGEWGMAIDDIHQDILDLKA